MPDSAILRLELHDWWHCSAGRGVRSGANDLAQRDGALPYVPGRTLKGLLRDAMSHAEYFGQCHAKTGAAAAVPAGATNLLFGLPTCFVPQDRGDFAAQRLGTQPGLLGVGNAELPPEWRGWAATPRGKEMLRDLAETLYRTAIGDDGLVRPNSLRSVEVMPPMRLDAVLTFHGDADPFASHGGWRSLVHAALPLLRALGAGRSRGLGRVTARLHKHGEQEAAA